jgi:hypothetical protein
MATKQVNGSVVTSTSTVNNGGTMVANGSAAALDTTSPNPAKVGVFGSTPIDNDDANKVLSGGEFAYNNIKPITKRVTTALAGVANDTLATTGGTPDLIRSIHKLETLTTRRLTTALRENKWNEVTGVWESGYPVNAVDTLVADAAANPTREVPGSLNFLYGAPTASGVNYSSKNT